MTTTTLSSGMQLFLQLAKIQSIMNRRFDGGLGGLGLSEFIILYHLTQAPEGKLRRIDLAEKLGLTASGVTRILLPMEKVGLVKREADENDGRVSFVRLGKAGKPKFADALERAEYLAEDVLPPALLKTVKDISPALALLSAAVH